MYTTQALIRKKLPLIINVVDDDDDDTTIYKAP